MKLNSIYKIMDKKILDEDWHYTFNQKIDWIERHGGDPMYSGDFKTKEDILRLCPEGTCYFQFNKDNEFMGVFQILDYNNKGEDTGEDDFVVTIRDTGREKLTYTTLEDIFEKIKWVEIIPFTGTYKDIDDDDDEIKEGFLGAVTGGLIGNKLGHPIIGAYVGHKIQNKMFPKKTIEKKYTNNIDNKINVKNDILDDVYELLINKEISSDEAIDLLIDNNIDEWEAFKIVNNWIDG